MGGEWIFLIMPKDGLSIERWQSELKSIRRKFGGVIGLENGTTAVFADGSLSEVKDNVFKDNVFAQFTYACDRHDGETGMWCLPWNPWEKVPEGHIHARCAPPNFARYSYEIQRHLENAFPESILIEWGDGLDGYNGSLLRSRGYKYHFPEAFPEIPRPLPRLDMSDLLLDVRSQLGLQLFQAIVDGDEEMVFRLVAEDQLDIDFTAPFGPEQEIDNGKLCGKRCFVREVSAVRLAIEQLVDMPKPVDHPEVAVQFRILRMILFREPKLEFSKLRSGELNETEDLARHVVFDAVGYSDSILEGTHFTPMRPGLGLAEVRIRMTLLGILLPAIKRRGPFQEAFESVLFHAALAKLENKELEWLLNEKPGWQLVKILKEFRDPSGFDGKSWKRWCHHDGLPKSFLDELDDLDLKVMRKNKEPSVFAGPDLVHGSEALTLLACRRALAALRDDH